MQIKDKIIVITGAASGIGKALAERFHQEGAAHLVLADLNQDALNAVAEPLNATAQVCDVSKEEDVIALVQTAEQAHGHIDLFCGNAGILRTGGVDAPNEIWEQTMAINVTAHMYAARAALPKMIERGEGYFLITASAAGLLNQVGSLSYGVSKHAALAVAEWIQITHGHQGIKVSALCPQAVQSAMLKELDDDAGSAGVDGIVSAEHVAECVVDTLNKEEFLVLPHPNVRKYFQFKASDYDKWLKGMQKLQAQFGEA